MFCEEEIKLTVSSAALLETIVLDVSRRFAVAEQMVDHAYVDRYFDCSEHSLLNHGLALRLRRQNGVCWLEIKSGGTISAKGVATRLEWRQILPDDGLTCCRDLPAGAVQRHLSALIPPDTPLVALFTVAMARRSVDVNLNGQVLMELAFDQGVVYTDHRRLAICEVEVERKSGACEPMVVFAQDLARRHGLIVAKTSKFSLGLALLGWKIPGWGVDG